MASTVDPRALRRLAGCVRGGLSPRRRRHSFATARLLGELCAARGEDPLRGRAAGLGHDIARELPPGRLLELAAADGLPIRPAERQQPVLLHGRAGARLLETELGLDDPQVLEAVRDHTVGRAGMGRLSRLLYAADFLEPGRDFVSEDFRRRALSLDLDGMLLMVVEQVRDWLRREGIPAEPAGEALYEELREKVCGAQAQER